MPGQQNWRVRRESKRAEERYTTVASNPSARMYSFPYVLTSHFGDAGLNLQKRTWEIKRLHSWHKETMIFPIWGRQLRKELKHRQQSCNQLCEEKCVLALQDRIQGSFKNGCGTCKDLLTFTASGQALMLGNNTWLTVGAVIPPSFPGAISGQCHIESHRDLWLTPF